MRRNADFEKLLKDFNSGIKKGSQSKLAQKLGIVSQAVNQWINGKNVPSEENIAAMAKIFKKSEKEIRKIFSIDNEKDDIKKLKEENKRLKKELEIRDELIELLKSKKAEKK